MRGSFHTLLCKVLNSILLKDKANKQLNTAYFLSARNSFIVSRCVLLGSVVMDHRRPGMANKNINDVK